MKESRTVTLDAVRFVFAKNVFRRNASTAFVVGCLLTLANQLDVMLNEPFSMWLAAKVSFNFLIPFVVASTSAALNRNCE